VSGCCVRGFVETNQTKRKKKDYIIIREKMEPSTSICRALFFLEGKKKERKRGKLYVVCTATFSVTRPPVIRSQWSVEMAFLGTKVATFSTSHEVMTVYVFSLGLLFRFKKYNQFPLLRQNNTKREEIYIFDGVFFSLSFSFVSYLTNLRRSCVTGEQREGP
jgi:hypothetical protein